MAQEKEKVDAYLDTIGRMEPEIAMVDNSAAAASIAISLKRIADAMEEANRIAQVADRQAERLAERLALDC